MLRGFGLVGLGVILSGLVLGDGHRSRKTRDFSAAKRSIVQYLPASPFVGERTGAFSPDDFDRDGILDEAEHVIAQAFRPYFIHDSDENVRYPGEPFVLYKVSPVDVKDGIPARVAITFGYLYAYDGGYGESSFCGNAHIGDNQTLRVDLDVFYRGRALRLRTVNVGAFTWPFHSMTVYRKQHPVVQLSAGKHHAFFDTAMDGEDSPYSDWGCNDDVNGRGAHVFPSMDYEFAPRERLNVGEVKAHPEDYFVNDLSLMGFIHEDAWSEKPFCGGTRRTNCDGTSPMAALWR